MNEFNPSVSSRAAILGLGSSIPSQILTNEYFEKIVETSDEWIRERTGISERRHALPNELNSDFASTAALNALASANIRPEEIDLIILATCTGDRQIPACACSVQQKIGAVNAAAFDLNAACSGFVYGLILANSMIVSGASKYILVIGSELLSRVSNMTDRTTCILFGDGAGAVVLGKAQGQEGILGHCFKCDGNLKDLITMPAGGSENRASHQTVDANLHTLQMRGSEVYKYAVTNLIEASLKAIELSGLSPADIDLVVPHQANTRILKSVAKRLGIDYESRFFINLDHIGNTSAASIPIALAEAVTKGLIKPGKNILMVAFGGGLTWGGAVVKF